jgi:Protein of unknown function (DUF2442)
MVKTHSITDGDIDSARQQGLKAMDALRAIAARYLPNRGRIEIDLSTGWSVLVPKDFSDRIAHATTAQCSDIHITDSGLGLHWPLLDEDWYVPAVIDSLTVNHMSAA